MNTESQRKLESKIDYWKDRLLDLSRKNRLLNFNENSKSNIIFEEYFTIGSQELYAKITTGKQKITLSFPFPNSNTNDFFSEETGNNKNKTSVFERALKFLKRKANTSLQEQGINTLYLAFGFLKWYDKENSSTENLSPLILIPVTLEIPKNNDEKTFRLELRDDEIVLNPTLRYKLSNDFGLEFPDFKEDIPDKSDILNFFHDFKQLISKNEARNNWVLLDKKVSLSILSFHKISMFGDLKNNQVRILTHPFIGKQQQVQYQGGESSGDYRHEHDNILPDDTFQVLDADSSQQDAILLSKEDKSFVLQGPPGTGKSQTITNIIAENLAKRKTVLFVSEKMAALNVVYQKLKNANLHDFCLHLHNHKANRQKIVEELTRTLNLNGNIIQAEAFDKLKLLKEKRDSLNSYNEELHKKRNPLGKSVFEIYASLAEIKEPHRIFELAGVEKMSKEEYIELENAVSAYAIAYSPVLLTQENPWLYSNIKEYGLEDKTIISENCKKLQEKLQQLSRFFENSEIVKLSELKHPNSFDDVQEFIEILSYFENFPTINNDWFHYSNIEELITSTTVLKDKSIKIRDLESSILAYCREEVFNLNINLTVKDVENSLAYLKKNVQGFSDKDSDFIIEDSVRIKKITKQSLSKIDKLYESFQNIHDELGIDSPNNILKLDRLSILMNLMVDKIYPREMWFNTPIKTLFDEFNAIKVKHEELSQLHNQVINDFNEKIYEIDVFPILQRFRTDYKNGFLKLFNSQYNKDKKLILGFARRTDINTDEGILETLNRLEEVRELTDFIEKENKKYIDTFGTVYYKGKDTDWKRFEEALKKFEEICSHYPQALPKKLKQFLLNDTPFNHKIPSSEFLKELTETLIGVNSSTPFSEISQLLQGVDKNTEFIDCYNEINDYADKKATNYNITIKLIGDISKYKSLKSQIADSEKDCQKNFGTFYSEFDTDWDSILDTLSNTRKLQKHKDKYNLSEKFIENIVSNDETFKLTLLSELTSIKGLNNISTNEMLHFKNWFDEDFSDYSINDLTNKVQTCHAKLELLGKTVNYKKEKLNCESIKLNSFITLIEKERPDSVLNTFKKHFYILWLDSVIKHSKVLNEFSIEKIESLRREFRNLDRKQLEIAEKRVRYQIITEMPTIRQNAGEGLILVQEGNKTRKFLPPRRLFNAIPTLLTSLKPCLMMSPLSVSHFLEIDKFKFDLVIFDEASQICTEDAIGAIIRSKQVIVVGDDKQLPPTNFFKSNEENDDEESDDGAYESILTEAMGWGVFEKSLSWHYRSRHEDLIAFSNYKIYDKRLITFPSTSERGKDIGVEYIYLPDGIYDKVGNSDRNNHNEKEAQKVVALVIEHYNCFPKRSLGVVTFSDAQRECIENCIEKEKKANISLQHLFSDNDSFFVKNIENVQGDERDTIIFSIGYGKNIYGQFHQNFGPLSKEGGHKRLNVAITRAKINVKLVGSIEPTDIKIEAATKEGPRLLRSYIEFAQQGVKALRNESIVSNDDHFDSPFEESVCEFLREKNYKVKTQIGCSGYRIDMAVLHPEHDGKFVIGIECDGAMYHSGRTARERDRLRQDVLEEMGWEITRIWSTDWFMNPEFQKKRLVIEIDKAIASYKLHSSSSTKSTSEDKDSYFATATFSDAEEKKNISESSFPIYESVTEEEILKKLEISKSDLVAKNNPKNPYLKKQHNEFVRQAVIFILEKESPIHFELLYQRLVEFYGQAKVTSKIRTSIDEIIKTLKDVDILDDKFLTKKNINVFPKRNIGSKIEYISQEELKQGLLKIAESSIRPAKDELLKITSTEFGFKKMGAEILNALEGAYNILKQEMLLIEDSEGKISFVKMCK